MDSQKILVTGGAGFIGTNLVNELRVGAMRSPLWISITQTGIKLHQGRRQELPAVRVGLRLSIGSGRTGTRRIGCTFASTRLAISSDARYRPSLGRAAKNWRNIKKSAEL